MAEAPADRARDSGDEADVCSCSEASEFDEDRCGYLSPPPDGTFSLDVFSQEFSRSPVYQAIVRCNLPALYHTIYCQGSSAALTDASFGVNFLHLTVSTAEPATESAFEPFVYALSNFRVDPSQEDEGGDTPLRRALRRGLPRLARALLRCGARQDPPADAAAIGEAPAEAAQQLRAVCQQFSPGLWAAVAAGDYFLVDRLLGCWCRVRLSRGDEAESLIGFARRCGAGSLVVELLEASRPTMEFAHAALAGDTRKMVQLLANRNVNADVRDRGHQMAQTLREAACAMGHRAGVLRLLPDRKSAGAAVAAAAAAAVAAATSAGRRRQQADVTRPASAVCGVM